MPLQQETSPAIVAPPDGVCHFDRLPPELLRMICSFAYGHQSTKRIITRLQWEKDQEDLVKRGTLASAPAFKHHVDHFLVSKRFFLNATEAFIKAQQLDQTGPGSSLNRKARLCRQSTIQLFARSVKVNSYADASLLRNFSSLRNVEVVIDGFKLESGLPCKKYAWLHVFEDHDLANLEFVEHLVLLRGLKTFTCIADTCFYADTERKRQVWQQNVLALEKYVRKFVTAPKPKAALDSSANNTESTPLYPGSRVTGIGCKSMLISVKSQPHFAFKPQQVAFDSSMVTRVMCLEADQLSRWVDHALRQHPELTSLLDDPGFATSR
ncbi:hypothetical protein CB0940_11505 [Cercospora beticola]|uniref:Uncharacterized protein n=1 Tax=Cercospora beticola TaxID=122368 RepID=A0A2G5HEA0_CERBT|nr:hypothetical protein CB0940_11505 [Cercospora beticola]PIA90593.1 hypothetical protein CB0940_11505 [Cercospora beticola]WPB08371.1 hypothetical protein RHO25_013037 [Cercospora beticola]